MTVRWEEDPGVPDGHPRLSGPATVAAALWLAVVGPVARASALPASRPTQVLAVTVSAAIAVLVIPERFWWGRTGIAVLAGAALLPSQGRTISIWVTVGLVLATWLPLNRRPVPLLPEPGPGALPAGLILTATAAWLGLDALNTWQPLAPLALAAAVPLVARIGGGLMERAAKRLGDGVAHIVSSLAFTVLGVLVLLPPWLVERTLRRDPLRPRDGWIRCDRRPVQSRQPWARDPATDPRPKGVALRNVGIVGLVVAVIAGLVWAGGNLHTAPAGSLASQPALFEPTGGSRPSAHGWPAAQKGQAWYPAYRADLAWALSTKVALRPFELYNLWDVKTRTVTILDNHRVGWQPPPCRCRRLTVWVYGGGGAFGFEQRDMHTIASDLARVANGHGVELDVVNRGLPGQIHEQAALRFAWDMAVERHPDLVLFYEGAEDVQSAEALNGLPIGALRTPYEALVENLWNEISHAPRDPTKAPPGTVADDRRVVATSPRQVGQLAVKRYIQSLGPSDDTARAYHVPVMYLWQPTRYTRSDAEQASAGDPTSDARQARIFAAASAALPTRVLDLTDVLAAARGPFFVDDVQIDEGAALLIAQAILERIQPKVDSLLGRPGGQR